MSEIYRGAEEFRGIPIPDANEADSLFKLCGILPESNTDQSVPWNVEMVYQQVASRFEDIEGYCLFEQRQCIIDTLDLSIPKEHVAGFLMGHTEGAKFGVAAVTWLNFLRSGYEYLHEYLDDLKRDGNHPFATDGEQRHMVEMRLGKGAVDTRTVVPYIDIGSLDINERQLDDSSDMAYKHVGDYLAVAPLMQELVQVVVSNIDDEFDPDLQPVDLYVDIFQEMMAGIGDDEWPINTDDEDQLDLSELDDDEHNYGKEMERELSEEEAAEDLDLMKQIYALGFGHAFTQMVAVYIETAPVRAISNLDFKIDWLPNDDLEYRGMPLPTDKELSDLYVLLDNETTAEESPAYAYTPDHLYEQLTRLSPAMEKFALFDAQHETTEHHKMPEGDAADHMVAGVMDGHTLGGSIMLYLLWQRNGGGELFDFMKVAKWEGLVPGVSLDLDNAYALDRMKAVYKGNAPMEYSDSSESGRLLEMLGSEYLFKSSGLQSLLAKQLEQSESAMKSDDIDYRDRYQAGLFHGTLTSIGMFIDAHETLVLQRHEFEPESS